MKRLYTLAIVPIIIGSCTAPVPLQVLKPADITLPPDIQKFTLVNRTKPDKKNQVWNVIEGVVTGEGVFSDREGADHVLSGLMQVMSQNPIRYTITQASIEYKGSGTEMFAPPLPWEEVERICKQYDSEALIVLESFDSDSRITHDAKPVQIQAPPYDCWDKNKNRVNDFYEDLNRDGKFNSYDCPGGSSSIPGEIITTMEYYVHARLEVKTGWRIYFPKEKRIVDEHRFSDFMEFHGKGATPEQAMAGLPNKRECIKQAGYKTGTAYGYRISPQWITVSRYFYTRGNDNMKIAGKRARQIGDWKSAIAIWKKEAMNTDKRIAWRACYNMAVACEREGNLEAALEWANKSYNIGHKWAAAHYVNAINFRIAEKQRLDEQMKGKK